MRFGFGLCAVIAWSFAVMFGTLAVLAHSWLFLLASSALFVLGLFGYYLCIE